MQQFKQPDAHQFDDGAAQVHAQGRRHHAETQNYRRCLGKCGKGIPEHVLEHQRVDVDQIHAQGGGRQQGNHLCRRLAHRDVEKSQEQENRAQQNGDRGVGNKGVVGVDVAANGLGHVADTHLGQHGQQGHRQISQHPFQRRKLLLEVILFDIRTKQIHDHQPGGGIATHQGEGVLRRHTVDAADTHQNHQQQFFEGGAGQVMDRRIQDGDEEKQPEIGGHIPPLAVDDGQESGGDGFGGLGRRHKGKNQPGQRQGIKHRLKPQADNALQFNGFIHHHVAGDQGKAVHRSIRGDLPKPRRPVAGAVQRGAVENAALTQHVQDNHKQGGHNAE